MKIGFSVQKDGERVYRQNYVDSPNYKQWKESEEIHPDRIVLELNKPNQWKGNPELLKHDAGDVIPKSEDELKEMAKPHVKKNAFKAHRAVVNQMYVEANNEVYTFDLFSMFFFFAEFVSQSEVGFEWKPKGKPERLHSSDEVKSIFAEARKIIRDSFTAYNLDRLDILNNANFEMTRLNSELEKQAALKAK